MIHFIHENIAIITLVSILWCFMGTALLFNKPKLTQHFDKQLSDDQILLFMLSFVLMVFWPLIWLVEKKVFSYHVKITVK